MAQVYNQKASTTSFINVKEDYSPPYIKTSQLSFHFDNNPNDTFIVHDEYEEKLPFIKSSQLRYHFSHYSNSTFYVEEGDTSIEEDDDSFSIPSHPIVKKQISRQ